MAVAYLDPTAFSNEPHTVAEIAAAIRSKQYGKDVREAMAQGFEAIDKSADIKLAEHKADDALTGVKELKELIAGLVDTIKQHDETNAALIESLRTSYGTQLTSLDSKWEDRLKRVTYGIDPTTIERVVQKLINSGRLK